MLRTSAALRALRAGAGAGFGATCAAGVEAGVRRVSVLGGLVYMLAGL